MRSWVLLFVLATATACAGSSGRPPAKAQDAVSSPRAVERPSDLTASELRSYDGYLQRFLSPCGGDGTLATCLEESGACRACPAAAKFVAKSIRSGFVAEEVEARYRARFDRSRVHAIDTRGAPSQGPARAPVTVVEFADFQCPFCAASVPIVDSLVESYAPHVRVVFMNFPISYHPFGQQAAQAGVAAHNQGKFWEMHHLMFANRQRLDRSSVEGFARSLNLDMGRFSRDLDSDETVARVKATYDQGTALHVRGTPAFFINGREFDFDLFDFGGDDLLSWIELEIELTTGKPYER